MEGKKEIKKKKLELCTKPQTFSLHASPLGEWMRKQTAYDRH